ncbi:ATP-binding cassette domain-containing protein [Lysobacter sp. N42]|uniref:ATP-binding cassette domain-containing protein n=1 Tax=Lysobacter sp. N42 TaxID=2545719 RepID=UPI00140467B0|nr:ATP-binding cassette domain-containing protein [Lysobacter sp. N42]
MILDIRGASVDIGRVRALESIDLSVAAGELVLLIGANASGKTSLLRAVAGHLDPRQGSIHRAVGSRRVADAIAPDRLPRMLSGQQALEFTADALGQATLDAALAYADAVSLRSWLHQPIGRYSLGTRQKLCIALSLVGEPGLYLWDEIANGLDLLSESRTMAFLRRRLDDTGAAALLATHNLDVAQAYADRVVLLHEGRQVGHWGPGAVAGLREAGIPLSATVLARMADLGAGVCPAPLQQRAGAGAVPRGLDPGA